VGRGVCVDIQYAAAVSIHNVIHIFRGLHTPKTRVFLRRVHINARVGEFVDDAAGGARGRERVGRVERAGVSRTRSSGRVSAGGNVRRMESLLHRFRCHTDSIFSDEFVRHPFPTYAPRKERNFAAREAERDECRLMRSANCLRNVIATGARSRLVSRLVI